MESADVKVPMLNHSGDLEAAGVGAVVRETTEVQVAAAMARRFPRNLEAINDEVKQTYKIASVAEKLLYRYPRSGKEITGYSVAGMRDLARIYGNFRSGFHIISTSENRATVRGFACDLEKNNWKEKDDTFELLIQRKDKRTNQTIWTRPDERDARELISKRGAFVERNAIRDALPSWLLALAEETAKYAGRTAARQSLERDASTAIGDLVEGFRRLQISKQQLETKLAHPVEKITPEEFADLRNVGVAIRDGEMLAADWLAEATPGQAVVDELNAKLGGQG